MFTRHERTITRAGEFIANEYISLRREQRRAQAAGEESKTGEALAGVYAGLLIFAAIIIGAATIAPSGK